MENHIPDELYDLIISNMPIACVDIAIVHKGLVLLVLRNDSPAKGQWWLPGGRIFKGEKMRDAALRKAREEVGIDCHVGTIIHTEETIFPDGPRGISIHSINSCFFLYPINPECSPKLDIHSNSFQWVGSINPDFHPYVKRCLSAVGLDP